MRHTMFRMQAMDRIFTTVDEARSVAEKHDDLIQLENAVLTGDSKKVLQGIKNVNPEALEKFADRFLPSLYSENKDVHNRIAGNILSTALREAQSQARSGGNKNLFNAVGHLSQFLFGKDVPPEATRRESSPELDRERVSIANERQQMYDNRARGFQDDVVSTGERLLRKELSRGLDPNNALPDFMKKTIIDTAINQIGDAMDKDEAHLGTINNLWARASRAGFSKEAKARLVAAWIGRAKSLAGPTRRKLVTEAVRAASGKPDSDRETTTRRPRVRASGRGTEGKGSRPKSARQVDWHATSDLDILEGKATLKKK